VENNIFAMMGTCIVLVSNHWKAVVTASKQGGSDADFGYCFLVFPCVNPKDANFTNGGTSTI